MVLILDGNCVFSWMAQRGYINTKTVCDSFLSLFFVFILLSPALAGDRYYFQATRRDYQRREGEWGRWGEEEDEGGSGVLQCEISSITPWASYIRDYFSFRSAFLYSLSLFFLLLLCLSLIFFLSLVLFPASLAFRPTWGWVLRGDKAGKVPPTFLFWEIAEN